MSNFHTLLTQLKTTLARTEKRARELKEQIEAVEKIVAQETKK